MSHSINCSIVIPVYNSAGCIAELCQKVSETMDASNKTWELILVNDGSPDNSWPLIQGQLSHFPQLVGINLNKNFGQHQAILAGLSISQGDIVIVMDDDLQHDPRDIPLLIEKSEQGYDVVYGNFGRRRHKLWKKLGSFMADKLANWVLSKPKHIYMSPFRCIRRLVVNEMIKYPGPNPFIDGLIFRVTQSVTSVDVVHKERFEGKSNYTVWASFKMWLSLLTCFSVLPLRTAVFTGLFTSLIGFGLGIFFIVQKFLHPEVPLGWTSTIVTLLIVSGVQLMFLGLIGEYTGRIFLNANAHPQFVIKSVEKA